MTEAAADARPGLRSRIAMFAPGLTPESLGWEGHRDLGRALAQLGHPFEILTTAAAPSDVPSPLRHLLPAAVPRALLACGAPILRTRLLLPAALALSRHLRVHGSTIDVLYVIVAYPHGAAAAIARVLSGWRGRLVVMPAGEDILVAPRIGFGFRLHPVPRALVRWTIRRANAVCCPSPMVREAVAALRPPAPLGEVADNVTEEVVRLSLETSAERAARARRARERLDAELGTARRGVVAALGRLHPVKGYDVLIEALAALPRAVAVIAGPSLRVRGADMAERLVELARARGVADRVHVLGHVPSRRKQELLAAADVVAVPSHCEGMPKVAIEALALGTPLALTRTCGLARHVGRGLGRTVPPADAVSLGAALAEILESGFRPDPSEARSLVERFSPSHVARALSDLVEAA